VRDRLFIICILIALFIGAIIIIGSALRTDSRQGKQPSIQNGDNHIYKERRLFTWSRDAMNYADMPESQRSMMDYYDNRAYPGAPPSITHPLLSEKGIGGKNCLQCHQNGGYVSQFKAFSPVTPHPEWLNCRQCHLPQNAEVNFKQSNWIKPNPPVLGQRAFPSAPLVIPHAIENRANCLSCHAGPGAAKEIRVSHPERMNCLQCHVPQSNDLIFLRPDSELEGIPTSRMIGSIEIELDEKKISEIKQWVIENE